MAATSEQAIDWAASRGFSILMDPHASIRELGDKRRRYAEKLAEAGFSDEGRDIPMARLIALAPTTARPRRSPGAARNGWSMPMPGRSTPIASRCSGTYDGKEPAQHYVDSVILHGTPESVVEQVGRLKEEIGLNYLMCAPLSRDTFRLLADQVLPRL